MNNFAVNYNEIVGMQTVRIASLIAEIEQLQKLIKKLEENILYEQAKVRELTGNYEALKTSLPGLMK